MQFAWTEMQGQDDNNLMEDQGIHLPGNSALLECSFEYFRMGQNIVDVIFHKICLIGIVNIGFLKVNCGVLIDHDPVESSRSGPMVAADRLEGLWSDQNYC